MSNCNWCGDEIKAGLWEIHRCIEVKGGKNENH